MFLKNHGNSALTDHCAKVQASHAEGWPDGRVLRITKVGQVKDWVAHYQDNVTEGEIGS